MSTFDQPWRARRSSKKNLKWLLIALVIGGLIWWYFDSKYKYFINTAVDAADTSNISIVIKKGQNIAEIGKNLAQKDLILDQGSFENYIRWNNFDRKIVAGRFLLNRTMTIPQIVVNISDSSKSESVLTIPEGATIGDIDQRLVDLELIQSGDFIQAIKNFQNYEKYPFLDKEKISKLPHPLEGFLFPDTFFLDANGFKSGNLIERLLDNFKKKIPQDLGEQAQKMNKSIFEVMIMASMVEKEVKTDKDRPIVAGILWKRLENHWQLGVDATLLYLKNDRTIDSKDLEEDSPYNTRKFSGLPPGPISNPGLKSMKAALNPEESPYFYYLTKPGTGEVIYARTNEEHNANRAKYLQ